MIRVNGKCVVDSPNVSARRRLSCGRLLPYKWFQPRLTVRLTFARSPAGPSLSFLSTTEKTSAKYRGEVTGDGWNRSSPERHPLARLASVPVFKTSIQHFRDATPSEKRKEFMTTNSSVTGSLCEGIRSGFAGS